MENKKLDLIVAENPVLVLMLGACPAMAATADVRSALAMGILVLAMLLITGIIAGLVGKFLPKAAKIPVYVIIMTAIAVSADMLLEAFWSDASSLLGIYAAVAAVDICVFNRAEAAEKSFVSALLDSVLTGVYFIAVMFVAACIREVFGSATFMGNKIAALSDYKVAILTSAPGGFAVLAILAAVVNKIKAGKAEACGIAAEAAGISKEA